METFDHLTMSSSLAEVPSANGWYLTWKSPPGTITHEHNELGKKDEEDKHRHRENHESNKQERHSEFKAEYHFVCKKSEKLVYIDVMLFSVFPGLEHLEVQLLTDTQQTALELTAKKKKIIF